MRREVAAVVLSTVLALLLVISSTNAQFDDAEFSGCGGFVGLSSALSKKLNERLDLSFTTIELYTLDGVLKEKAECAPNGYYFMPVYERNGVFRMVVNGPAGWHVDPSDVRVEIGEDGQCNMGNDINFQYTGFSVRGSVYAGGINSNECENPGVPGVTLQLFRAAGDKATGAAVTSTTSSDTGSFVFTNVAPGTYVISAQRAGWSFAKESTQVTVEWDNVEIPAESSLIVTGFDVSGRITSAQGEPAPNVEFHLYFIDEDGEEGEQVDTMVSGDNGVFSFSNVKCGSYRLLPVYRDEHTTFDLHPASLVFDVKGSSVAIAEVFRVTGFSARGRVVQHAGAKGDVGIDNVVVTVYQQRGESGSAERHKIYETTTAADGTYRLETMASATYTIEARRAHYHFADLVALSITPRNCAQLPDIVLKSLDLCGSIVIDRPPPGVSVDATRSVELYAHTASHEDEAQNVLQTAHTKAGAFCFHVPPGDYIVKPVIKTHEERNGLLLMPPSQFIHVDTAPILDVHFVQSRVKVSGRVSCIVSPCDASLSVVLAPQDQKTPKLTATLEAAKKGLASSVANVDANEHHTFVFRDVLPGRYEVLVSGTNWCWKQPSFKIEVRSEDVGDLAFVQTGFVLALSATHATEVELSLASTTAASVSKHSLIQVPKGASQQCLEAPGTYTIVPKSCYRFEHTSYSFDTAAPAPVSLVVSHYQTRGSIAVSQAHSLPDSLRVRVQSGSKHAASAAAAATPVIETAHRRRSADGAPAGEAVYEFVAWGKLGETLTLRPETDGQLLFYPRTAAVTISKAECSGSEATSFAARPGLFLDGNVIPAIADVQITVRYADTNEVVVSTATSGDGHFRAGPLYDDVKYLTKADKAGFHFTIEDDQDAIPTTFRSVRLGRVQIAVSIAGEPLGGVLALLSGANAYKGKDTTSLESGLVEFDSLFPGAYFVRPVLKEYEFEPRNVAFDVVEGTTKDIEFVATRTGYSCFGQVRSLTGEPEKTAVVEAVLLDSAGAAHTEETKTDNAGNYRLRGLRPNAQYTIQLKASEQVERSLPPTRIITTGTSDTRGIDFVLFKHSNTLDISGTIDAEPEFYSSLTVELRTYDDDKTVKELPLTKYAHFFEFTNVPKDSYIIRLRSSLSTRQYDYTLRDVAVPEPNAQRQSHVAIRFDAKLRPLPTNVAPTSVFPLIFGVLLLVGFYNYAKIFEFVQQQIAVYRGIKKSGSSGESWDDVIKRTQSGQSKRNRS